MCKQKSSTDVVHQRKSSSRSPLAKGPRSSSNPQRLYGTPSTSGNSTTNTGSSSIDWWRSSATSKASLSSLRESLPENPHIYDFSEICSATNNFLAKKLSFSSSSSSWRCVIRGNDVAVIQRKLRRRINMEELRDQLSSICKCHHASLINLRGASISGSYIYLVYDYVHGANLVDCLRNARNPSFTILSNWMSRVQIASDLAHGLDYIHHSTGLSSSFVHSHIKSSSIIVTESQFSAKICHFGTAELCGEIARDSKSELDWSECRISERKEMKFEGTRGYMSPEFQVTGIGTQKSDVYAFGVVVLELLSGAEPLKYRLDDTGGSYQRISVVETAREAVEGGAVRLRRWIDKRLKDSYPVDAAERMVRVGLDCVKEDPGRRPNMGQVVGRISKLYLDSKTWTENMSGPTDLTISLAAR